MTYLGDKLASLPEERRGKIVAKAQKIIEKIRKDNVTGHTGIALVNPTGKRPYRAYFFYNKEKITIGTFKTIEEAVTARNDAMAKHEGVRAKAVSTFGKKLKKSLPPYWNDGTPDRGSHS